MLRRVQGKLAFGTLAGRQRAHPAVRPAAVDARVRRVQPRSRSATGSGATGEVDDDPAGRAVGAGRRRGCCWPRPAGQFPDKWHGLTDVDTRYRQRYVDLWVTDEARDVLLHAQPGRQPHPPLAGGPRLRRGGDADLPPDPRRRDAPSRSSPTTTRSTWTCTCASRPSSTSSGSSSAASRRCSRSAGCSATRASAPAGTPSSRCSSCTRRTPTTAT